MLLSPFLFSVAMVGLPEALHDIEGLNYSLYADDIPLWVTAEIKVVTFRTPFRQRLMR